MSHSQNAARPLRAGKQRSPSTPPTPTPTLTPSTPPSTQPPQLLPVDEGKQR